MGLRKFGSYLLRIKFLNGYHIWFSQKPHVIWFESVTITSNSLHLGTVSEYDYSVRRIFVASSGKSYTPVCFKFLVIKGQFLLAAALQFVHVLKRIVT